MATILACMTVNRIEYYSKIFVEFFILSN